MIDCLQKSRMGIVVIRSSCNRYEHEKSIFLKFLEKNRAGQSHMRMISYSEKEVNDEKEINTELFKFYKPLFQPMIKVSDELIQDYLDRIEIPKLNTAQLQGFEGVISEYELLKALKKVPNYNAPGKNGIAKEFYEALWDDLKTTLLICY